MIAWLIWAVVGILLTLDVIALVTNDGFWSAAACTLALIAWGYVAFDSRRKRS